MKTILEILGIILLYELTKWIFTWIVGIVLFIKFIYDNKDFHICDSCLIELQLSTRFYIGGVEVTPEEYYRRIQDGK